MPEYGSRLYWDQRYSKSEEAFDWMCDYEQLEPTILPLLSKLKSNKHCKILIIGCGNANFSVDFVNNSGFNTKNVIHIDYCDVVIQQQKKKFPSLDFRVMDALNMAQLDDDTIDCIIDKSLIDTTLCYHDGHETTERLFTEMHRVLKNGGRIVTISLHTEEEVKLFQSSDKHNFEFLASSCKIVNKRRQKEDYDVRCLYHTVAVFDKVKGLSTEDRNKLMKWHENATFENALSDDHYNSMVNRILRVQGDCDDGYYPCCPATESLSLELTKTTLDDNK